MTNQQINKHIMQKQLQILIIGKKQELDLDQKKGKNLKKD